MDKQNILIIILVLVVAVLGYVIYRSFSFPAENIAVGTPPASPPQTRNVPPPPAPQPAKAIPILTIPGSSASPEEYRQYINAVIALAKETNMVEIGPHCIMNPLVLKVGKFKEVAFSNKDTFEHTLLINGINYKIIPASSKKISLPAGLKGVQGYTCLPAVGPGPSGILFYSN